MSDERMDGVMVETFEGKVSLRHWCCIGGDKIDGQYPSPMQPNNFKTERGRAACGEAVPTVGGAGQ